MADRTARVLIGVESDTGQAVQGFERIDRELERMGAVLDELEEGNREFGDSFDRVQRNIDDFNRQLKEVGDVGPGEIERIVKSMALLEDEIRDSGRAMDDLDDETRQTFSRMQKETDEAIKKTARLETAWEGVEEQTKSQVQSFSGIGDALTQISGKAGTAALKIGLVATAAQQGWQQGMALNQELQRDMSEWESLWAKLKVNVNLIISGWVNTLLSGIQAVQAAWDGLTNLSLTKFRKGMDQAADSMVTGVKQMTGAVTTFGDETEKVAAATGEVTEKARAKYDAEREAMAKAREEAKTSQQAAEDLAGAKTKLAQEVHTVTVAMTEETAAMVEQATSKALATLAESLGDVQYSAAIAATDLLTKSFAELEKQALAAAKAVLLLDEETKQAAGGGGSSEFGPGIKVTRSGSSQSLTPGDTLSGGSL